MTNDARVARVQDAFWSAGEKLLFRHTNPWELDEALVDWGFGIGPCEAQDLVGLDLVLRRQGAPVSPILSRMVAEGRLGKIGGVGFYRYPGRGGAVIDPLIEDLIREEAWFAKQERSELTHEEVLAQMLTALRETAHMLAGSAMATGEIEKVLRAAVHFPAEKVSQLWSGDESGQATSL